MPILAILADDLTGANDTGVQFARQGLSCSLAPFWKENLSALDAKSPIWVFNTESRHCPPEEAARRTAQAAEFAKKHGAKILYKKTDSVLRGPIGAELEAVSKAWKSPVIYVPAFPAAGRTVRDGNLYVDGVPLNETAFANDPLAPVTTASIAERLGVPFTTVSLHQLRKGSAGFQTLQNIVMVEGETEKDLQRTAKLAKRGTMPTCWAGPAAFAFHLAKLFKLDSGPVAPSACPAPILLVNGSLHPASIRQTARAVQKGCFPVELSETRQDASAAIAALKNKKCVALYHVRMEGDAAAAINRRLTATAAQILRKVRPGTLLIFGGETSQSVLRSIGATACRIISQIDWSLVLIEAQTTHGVLKIITKSGGFGADNLIERIRS